MNKVKNSIVKVLTFFGLSFGIIGSLVSVYMITRYTEFAWWVLVINTLVIAGTTYFLYYLFRQAIIERSKGPSQEEIDKTKQREDFYKSQIDNYKSYTLTVSARGDAALTMVGFYLVSLLLVADLQSFVIFGLFWLPLAYLVYKGKSWAMIIAGLIWTVERGLMLLIPDIHGGIVLITYLVVVVPLYRAYEVERRIIYMNNEQPLPPSPMSMGSRDFLITISVIMSLFFALVIIGLLLS